MGLGRIGSAVIVGMVLLCVLWAVSLPFGLVDLWWQHHWGLGPLDILAWLNAQWAVLGAEAVSVMLTIVLLVGLAGRFRRWWLVAGARVRRDRGHVRAALRLAERSRYASAPRPCARGGRQTARAHRRSSGHTRQRRGRVVLDRSGERVHGGVRPIDARRGLGHAARRPLLARRGGRGRGARARSRPESAHPEGDRLERTRRAPDALAPVAGAQGPWRPRPAGEPAVRVPRARRSRPADARRCRTSSRVATRRRPTGGRFAQRETRQRRRSSSRASRRRASSSRTRRAGTTSGSRTTRR